MQLKDPIVIDPPNFDIKAEWDRCRTYVDRMEAAGRDLAAAFGADPGVCSCPSCKEMHWAWGRQQRCTSCGFEYPTDWWPMYSYGVCAARHEIARYAHKERISHPYYKYGFENPVEDALYARDTIDWKYAMKDK